MPQLVNWELLRTPYNWFVVGFVVALLALATTAYHNANG